MLDKKVVTDLGNPRVTNGQLESIILERMREAQKRALPRTQVYFSLMLALEELRKQHWIPTEQFNYVIRTLKSAGYIVRFKRRENESEPKIEAMALSPSALRMYGLSVLPEQPNSTEAPQQNEGGAQ